MLSFRPLSPLASFLISSLQDKGPQPAEEAKIAVNPIVSKFASWYERLRNAMEYREDEVILRATIERILKRRLLLGGTGKTTAEPLVKELLWARYIPENEVSLSVVRTVEETIDLYLALRLKVMERHRFSETIINDWTYDLMSSDIQYTLNPKREKEIMANFMFYVMKDNITIVDDTQETKDAQVYMAVRKAFARDDLAFLRYHLFTQYFGKLSANILEYAADNFPRGYSEILRELHYPAKDKIYTYVKRQTAAFFILDDVLNSNKDNLKTILENEEELRHVVSDACDIRYKGIASKVQRAIIRSVIFILMTKFAFAFLVEGTYENLVYHHIQWPVMIVNTTTPPLLMVIVGLFLRPPGKDNSKQIYEYITQLLYTEKPRLSKKLAAAKHEKRSQTFNFIFNFLWLVAFVISFGCIVVILSKIHFNFISQFIFIFFLAIVSFLSYRISLIANIYRVGEKQGFFTLLIDFLFMPVIRTGRRLTQSISQVNIFLMLFDFLIEAPFKYLFAFFDQWFYYLHNKTEELE